MHYLEVGAYRIDNILLHTGLWVHSPPRGTIVTRRTATVDLNVPLSERLFGQVPANLSDKVQAQWLSTLAYAILANFAGNIFSVTEDPEHLNNATLYIGKCMAGLRRYLSEGCAHPDFKPESLIFRLFRAEMAVKSFSNAMVHAIYLKKVIEDASSPNGNVDLPFILHEVYNCNQLALTTWTQPLYDTAWIENVFRLEWDFLPSITFNSTSFQEALSEYTHREDLANLMTATKALFLQTAESIIGGASALDEKWYRLQSRCEWLQTSLFNIARAEEERAAAIPKHDDLNDDSVSYGNVMSAVDMHTAAAYMNIFQAIASILSIRYRIQDPMLNKQSISPVLRLVLTKLSSHYGALDPRIVTQHLLGQYRKAFLWVAFVAALVENRNREFLQKHNAFGLWFKVLSDIIKLEKFRSWEQLRACLEQFPFSEDETPLPCSTWLDEAFRSARSSQ
jgi:hypothetical protein